MGIRKTDFREYDDYCCYVCFIWSFSWVHLLSIALLYLKTKNLHLTFSYLQKLMSIVSVTICMPLTLRIRGIPKGIHTSPSHCCVCSSYIHWMFHSCFDYLTESQFIPESTVQLFRMHWSMRQQDSQTQCGWSPLSTAKNGDILILVQYFNCIFCFQIG